jgi:hypothetical protein
MRRVLFLSSLFLLSGALIAGCPERNIGGGDDDDATDDDDAMDDDDATDDDDDVQVETECDDGADNDADGLFDCGDPDCAAEEHCSWPTAISQRTDVEFEGYEIECGSTPLEFDYQMPDCADRFTATMERRRNGNLCVDCDRTYQGAYTPVVKGGEDSCSELLDQPAPTEGAFGIVFTSATSWTVWTEDGTTGAWSEVGLAEDDGSGTMVFASGDVVNERIDTGIIDCRQQDIGYLAVALQFSPVPEAD